MLFNKPLFGMKVDLDGFNPDPVPSPFIDIEAMPKDLSAMPNKVWQLVWFFLGQIKWPIISFTILFGASSVLTALLPYFLGQIVAVFENTPDPTLVWEQLKPALFQFVFWMIIMDSGLYHIAWFIRYHITTAVKAMIQRQLVIYTRHHSLNYFQSDFAGRLSNKINDTAEAIRDLFQFISIAVVFGASQFVVGIIITFSINTTYGLFVLLFVIFYGVLLMVMIPKVVKSSVEAQNSKTVVTGQVVDEITNISSVKLFARQNLETNRLTGFLNDFVRKSRHMHVLFWRLYIWFDVIMKMLWVSFFGLLFWNIYTGNSSFSEAVLLVPVVISVTMTIWWFGDVLIQIFEKIGTVQDGIDALIKPFDLIDTEDAQDLKVQNATIDIKDMNFTYPGQPVFESLDLSIPAGQKIGLVGPSGAGKTTLVQLLLRLHDIQGGSIEIDGQDIADVTQNSLREHIAVIPQHTDLLHRSIKENITYGNPDASEEEIIEAAKRAHAHDFILGLVDHEGSIGYDAKVGERGVKLSGGQRQRIAIARAILKDAPILLLDEATSALDSESERLIQESLTELMEGRTVIAIAHRLSTISKLDRLLVMDQGRIIEDGTHQELLKNKGLYAKLWALQSGGFIGVEQ